jgi:ankyrin repeat protein
VLLRNRADINHVESRQQNALDVALSCIDTYLYASPNSSPSDVVELLLQAGCKIDFASPHILKHDIINKSKWLLAAAAIGDVDRVRVHLRAGGIPQSRWSEDGNNALSAAIIHRNMLTVELLWKAFAKSCKFVMMLKQACKCIFMHLPFYQDLFLILITRLIGDGAWLIRNNDGKTFLDLAGSSDDPEIKKFFRDPFRLKYVQDH